MKSRKPRVVRRWGGGGGKAWRKSRQVAEEEAKVSRKVTRERAAYVARGDLETS
jgi:hypothetical protein